MADQSQDAAKKMIANLIPNTGKSIGQWHKELSKKGFTKASKHGEILKMLKAEYAVTHGYANLIALKFREEQSDGETDLVAQQYSGDRQKLKPIYDKLIKKIAALGPEVSISPKKTYVSLRHKKQFALIQPSTKTRLDIGINLGEEKPSERLEKSGSFNTMVSHRVRVENLKDIDGELMSWLKQAYVKAG